MCVHGVDTSSCAPSWLLISLEISRNDLQFVDQASAASLHVVLPCSVVAATFTAADDRQLALRTSVRAARVRIPRD